MGLELVDVLGENDGNDKVREGHAEGAHGENGLAAELVNVQNGWDCWRGVSSAILSWKQNNSLAINMTIPTTPVASRDMVFPVSPICLKIVGA